jgi:Flp pilus assembly protein TadG
MKILHRDQGNALIEVALFLPILISLLLGVLDFGFLLQQYMTVLDSARAGAEAAMMRNYAVISVGNAAFLANVATTSASNIPNYTATASSYCSCAPTGAVGSTVSCASHSNCPGYGIPAQYTKVVVTASLPILFGLTGFPATYDVQSSSIVRTAWTGTQ